MFAWNAELSGLSANLQDIYFTHEYHSLHVANGDGEADCTILRGNDSLLFVPGLIVPIPSKQWHAHTFGLFDLQTCNGYGGPIASENATREFLEYAWGEWKRDVAKRGIVAAFFRLHPMMQNERWLPADAQIFIDRKTAFVELNDGIDVFWNKTSSKHRNMVNKGRRDGVVVTWNARDGWLEFEKLYNETMERIKAPYALRFSSAYFERLKSLPGAELACVVDGGQLQAASVFLFGKKWAHYHLSVRLPGAENSITNVILQDAINHAAEIGLSGLHLGGGRTAAPEDTLFKFKSSVGTKHLDFKVALVVSDTVLYNQLCENWKCQAGRNSKWLLSYRESY